MDVISDVIATDVLVVGGGIAGLLAAVTARRAGREVLLCAKAAPGKANSSALSQGSFRAAAAAFSPERHVELTLEAGHGLNEPALVAALAREAAAAVLSLREFGVEVRVREKGFFVPAEKMGQEGINVTGPLTESARRLGVKFLSPFLASGLLQKGGQAAGVWGVQKKDGAPLAVAAKAVVLAAGGAGAAFARTDNPPGSTGDGYALAYRAGLPLIDLEFVQFYPLATAQAGRPGRFVPAILADAGKLLNAAGEDLLEKDQIKKAPVAIVCRDLLSRAMCREVAAGRGIAGAIRLDLRVSEADWQRAQKLWGYGDEELNRVRAWADGLAAGAQFVPVLPTAHFCMGGVAAGSQGQTGIPGFFAAGEVTGGLHGANRLGGNALTETVVFGRRAGQAAAEFAAGQKAPPLWGREAGALAQEAAAGCLFGPARFAGREGKEAAFARSRQLLRQILWEGAGVLRSAAALKKTLATVANLEEEIAAFPPGEPARRFDFLELLNLLLVARLTAAAALYREESRGAHYRQDFPQPDDLRWRRHTQIRRGQDGRPEITSLPAGFLD